MSALEPIPGAEDRLNALPGETLRTTVLGVRLWLSRKDTGSLSDFVWIPDGAVANLLTSVAGENRGKPVRLEQEAAVLEFEGPFEALTAAKIVQEKLSLIQEEPDCTIAATVVVYPLRKQDDVEETLPAIQHVLETSEPGHILVNDEIYQVAWPMPFFEFDAEPKQYTGNGTSAPMRELLWADPTKGAGPAPAGNGLNSPVASTKAPRNSRYEIVSEIGHGAMGVVYKAHDRVINRIVALKTIPIDSREMGRGELIERLQREAKAAGSLDHPNIITIYDVGEEDNLVYLSMQFVEGETLSSLLAGRKLFPIPDLLVYVDQICSGVGFAHQRGIIHRDLKPSNLMLTTQGTIKILDFGIAKSGDTSMTQAGMVIGTPDYMAPEQAAGRRIDHRSDIFTLGTVFYELFTGEKAFAGQSIQSILYKVMNEDPVPASVIEPSLPRGIDAIIQRALAKDPQQRFQSCEEMRDAFRQQGMALGTVYGTQTTQRAPFANSQYAVAAAGNSGVVSASHIFGASTPSVTAPDIYSAPPMSGPAGDPSNARKLRLFAWAGGATVGVAALAIIIGFNSSGKKTNSRSSVGVQGTANALPVATPAMPPSVLPTTQPILQEAGALAKPAQGSQASSISGAQPAIKNNESRNSKPKNINKKSPSEKLVMQANTSAATASDDGVGFTKEDVPGLLSKADNAYGRGDYGESIKVYNLILRVDSQNADAISGKARALEAQKDKAKH